MNRITWRAGNYSAHRGYAGTQEVVSLAWKTARSGPNYVVQTPLPAWVPSDLKGSDDLDAAKAMAEELVTSWLHSIGADWAKTPDLDNGSGNGS